MTSLAYSYARGHGEANPRCPPVYSDEVWTGIEYQVASHMCWEGLIDEALSIVRAVRERYEGKVRNPWNEYECGNYYVRAMASYGLLLGLSGFRYTASQSLLELAPQLKENKGQLLFSVDSGWGTIYYQKSGGKIVVRIEVEEGPLDVHEVRFGGASLRGC